jgi:hypothetical protein
MSPDPSMTISKTETFTLLKLLLCSGLFITFKYNVIPF